MEHQQDHLQRPLLGASGLASLYRRSADSRAHPEDSSNHSPNGGSSCCLNPAAGHFSLALTGAYANLSFLFLPCLRPPTLMPFFVLDCCTTCLASFTFLSCTK